MYSSEEEEVGLSEGRERAPALLWMCSSEEEEAGLLEGREKVYIYPSPQWSLKS